LGIFHSAPPLTTLEIYDNSNIAKRQVCSLFKREEAQEPLSQAGSFFPSKVTIKTGVLFRCFSSVLFFPEHVLKIIQN
jgi:hypothetical protein